VVTTLSAAGVRVPHRALGGGDRAYRYHDWRVARALERLGDSVDIVHCWPRATLQTSASAKRLGIPTLREVPNTHTAHAYERAARETEALGLRLPRGHSHAYDPRRLERELGEYDQADFLLVPSEFSKRTFTDRGFAEDRLLLHRYGFDPDRFFPDVALERGAANGGLSALFAGACEPRKGLHHALRAWRASGADEHGRLIVCGRFAPGYRDALGSLLEHPSIEVRGFVGDVGELMRRSHVFVFPSIEEGSALVTYEAQGCGCVLAVSDAAGARCEHGRQGLVHPAGDVSRLTEHLHMLSTDRGLLSRMRAATVASREELSWDRAGEELVETYESALRSGFRDEGVAVGLRGRRDT
jgi:glycosyltransferase involved in cell wall biosynthesis